MKRLQCVQCGFQGKNYSGLTRHQYVCKGEPRKKRRRLSFNIIIDDDPIDSNHSNDGILQPQRLFEPNDGFLRTGWPSECYTVQYDEPAHPIEPLPSLGDTDWYLPI